MARRARFSDFDGVITEEMLSDRQRAILDFIREHVYAKGYPPAVREIGKAVGLSSSASVHTHLHKLEEYGFLQRDPAKPRAIELTQDSSWRHGKRKKHPSTRKMLFLKIYRRFCKGYFV